MVTPEEGAASAATTPLSLRAYGRHRNGLGLPGGNAVAVSRAIATQRLVRSVVYVEGTAQIADAALADQEWASNTDLSRAPSTVKAQAEGVTPPVVTGARVTGRTVTSKAKGSPLVEASTREKNARADLAELDYLERAGQLISAAEVEAKFAARVMQARTGILSVPSKYKGLLPHLTHAELALLNDLLCQELEKLAEKSVPTKVAAA